MMARKKKIHHRHNRLSFGGKLAFVLLTILSAVILIPIVFTFLYSFFPQSEITAYLKGRGSYDTTKWLDVLYSPAMFSLRQYYKIFIEEPSYLKLFCKKSDTAKQYVQQWLPIVAAAQLTKDNELEKDFLMKWIDVIDYQ